MLNPGWTLIDSERRARLSPRTYHPAQQHLDCLKVGDLVQIGVESKTGFVLFWCEIVSTAGQTMQVRANQWPGSSSGISQGDVLDIDYRHIMDFDEAPGNEALRRAFAPLPSSGGKE